MGHCYVIRYVIIVAVRSVLFPVVCELGIVKNGFVYFACFVYFDYIILSILFK